MPASETSAIRSPAASRGSSSATRAASLCSCSESSRAEIPWRSSSPRVCRVSSASTTSASRSSVRTRSVTSSRFPIGVAQTASGIRQPRRRPGPAPIRPARAPRIARSIASAWPAGASASVSTASRADGSSRSNAATPKPPPITTISGWKMLTSEPIATPRWCPTPFSAAMPLRYEVVRSRIRAEDAPGERVGCPARAVRLDVTAPGAGAAARLAVLDDHHVAELGPAVEERAADDDAAADAGAEREQHEVLRRRGPRRA